MSNDDLIRNGGNFKYYGEFPDAKPPSSDTSVTGKIKEMVKKVGQLKAEIKAHLNPENKAKATSYRAQSHYDNEKISSFVRDYSKYGAPKEEPRNFLDISGKVDALKKLMADKIGGAFKPKPKGGWVNADGSRPTITKIPKRLELYEKYLDHKERLKKDLAPKLQVVSKAADVVHEKVLDLIDQLPNPVQKGITVIQEKTMSRYQIPNREDYIAQGSFGAVYNVDDSKVMKVPLRSDDESIKNEKKMLDYLNRGEFKHTGVQGTQKLGVIKNGRTKHTVVVMKKYSGGDVSNFLEKNPATEKRAEIGYDIVKGLIFLRKNHVIHWDIKPGNCLMGESRAVIGDLGGAKHESDCSGYLTATFMPPQLATLLGFRVSEGVVVNKLSQSQKERYLDDAGNTKLNIAGKDADIYAMGRTLFEVFTRGKPELPNLPPHLASKNHINSEIADDYLHESIPDEHTPVGDIIYKMIYNYTEVTDRDLHQLLDGLKRMQ